MTATSARRVLLIGGTSEIGLSVLRRLSADGPIQPFLIGRNRTALDQALRALPAPGPTGGGVLEVDADDLGAHEAAVAEVFSRAGGFDLVVLAVGQLGAQEGLDAPPDRALEIMRVDFVGAGSLMMSAMRRLREQGRGTLIVLSSAAVERPRAANAVYGAAKAGLDALAQGLADSLQNSGVRVLVVRPGFVKTRMTAGLKGPPFSTTPEAVAEATAQALPGRAHTIWVPGAIRYVFMVLRHLPRPLYRRLPL
ncbi:MAG TPA: SDR family NAD(P)-dependent oxidoreductase [Solirubrobacteraceae bacterium]|nr:SDR family NAD(P)-dependent oxidoreductase [Solirubrobacteraceae bacterium]